MPSFFLEGFDCTTAPHKFKIILVKCELVLDSHGEVGFCKVCLKQNLIWTSIPADAFNFKVVAANLLN